MFVFVFEGGGGGHTQIRLFIHLSDAEVVVVVVVVVGKGLLFWTHFQQCGNPNRKPQSPVIMRVGRAHKSAPIGTDLS